MISAVTPVYKESTQQIASLIEHLTAFKHISEIIIAATEQDQHLPEIRSFLENEFEQVELVVSSIAGRAVQMNLGASTSEAQYLLFLHCDTRLPMNADDLIIDALADKNWGRFDIQLDDDQGIFKIIAWFMNKRSRLTQISTGDQAIFAKRDFFQDLGGFPNQLLMEDVEFSRRAKKISASAFIAEPATTSARRWQHSGVAKTVVLMWWLRALYWLGVSPDRLAQMYSQIR